MCACVYLCVSVPEVINNYWVIWNDIKPMWLVEKVIQVLYGGYN